MSAVFFNHYFGKQIENLCLIITKQKMRKMTKMPERRLDFLLVEGAKVDRYNSFHYIFLNLGA